MCVKRALLFSISFFFLFCEGRPNRNEPQPNGCFLFIHIDATNVNRNLKKSSFGKVFNFQIFYFSSKVYI